MRLRSQSLTSHESEEVSDSALRREYHRVNEAYREGIARDERDVERGLKQERWFTVDWNRMSRNKIWAAEAGPECKFYDGTPGEYTNGAKVWPRGRHLGEMSIYRQLYDFFRFMWSHTRPYKTVAVILIRSIAKPLQVAVLSFVAQYIQQHPHTTPLWFYFFGFYGYVGDKFLYWWYEMWVPLNSQRVQLRCVLLKKRSSLPHDHPMAVKWPVGRFTGLLKDVDDVINGIWLSMLSLIDDLVTILYLIILCFVNLAISTAEVEDTHGYGVYVSVFLGLTFLVMVLPFICFHMFDNSMQDCESMIRDGQALYMSASNDRLLSKEIWGGGRGKDGDDVAERRKEQIEDTAVKAYWLYGRATFRAFFHRLAWQTNYEVFMRLCGPFVAYFFLTESVGTVFGPANILIVLLSLKDMSDLSIKVLEYLMKMSRGCNVLRDVAELLNAKKGGDFIDLENGNAALTLYRRHTS